MAKPRRRTETAKKDYPLKDAKRDLVLKITEADIRGSKRKSNGACAAATALCRQEHFTQAIVHKTTTLVQLKGGSWERYLTPDNLYIELMIYDRGGRMQAADYKLTAPTGTMRLGQHAKPRGKLGRTGRTPKTIHIIENVRADSARGPAMFKALFG